MYVCVALGENFLCNFELTLTAAGLINSIRAKRGSGSVS